MSEQTRVLILGAHPDDAEFHAGGLAIRHRDVGHTVKMVSVTNGAAGHHRYAPQELACVRRAEAAKSGRVIGADYVTWDFPDGALQPTLEVRHRLIREIREFRPNLVLTHRTNDYHPDHRAVGQAVQDASYLVTVPLVVPDVPILERDPVVAYMPDLFTRPNRLQPDVVVDVAPHLDRIVSMLACHGSQFFDFLPYNQGISSEVPVGADDRVAWLRGWYLERLQQRAAHFRTAIESLCGPARAAEISCVEVFEVSEYASPLDDENRERLFPGHVRD